MCQHNSIRFGSGDYYVFCDSCNAKWARINPTHDGPDTIDATAANQGYVHDGKSRKIVVTPAEK